MSRQEHESNIVTHAAIGAWMVECRRPVAYVPTIAELESIYYSAINADELLWWIEGELEHQYELSYDAQRGDERDLAEQMVNGWRQ